MSISSVWREIELPATGDWVDFEHESGLALRRPTFYAAAGGGAAAGGSTGPGDGAAGGAAAAGVAVVRKVRFAAPLAGRWRWTSEPTPTRPDVPPAPGGPGGAGASSGPGGAAASSGLDVAPGFGEFDVAPALDDELNPFYRHGFWRMSPGGRSLVHADGTPALLVADTAWALPWRATPEQVREYAADRQSKGFNAVLLMTVQPDMRAVGPRDRTQDEGFDVGFEDLPDGHLRQLNAEYFQYLDDLLDILVEHGIVPVLQPVFQGFGWKGLDVAGTVVPEQEYAAYCRYLVARYGARPAIYLVGGDGSGAEPQTAAGGAAVHAVDCYEQPTGIHYRPHIRADAHQDAEWLDFQWCQTGHTGEHVPERVADMWRNHPVKAVANGEPTYEHTGRTGVAEGWWQGHEAWSNLCAGGTMGVVYGAGSLWQWRLHGEEPGHSEFFLAPGAGWREAIGFEGSTYVGMLGKILDGLPTTDMAPDWTRVISGRALSTADGGLIVYRENGGPVLVFDDTVPLNYTSSTRATARSSRPAGGTRREVHCLTPVAHRGSTSAYSPG